MLGLIELDRNVLPCGGLGGVVGLDLLFAKIKLSICCVLDQ